MTKDASLLPAIAGSGFDSLRGKLDILAMNPPQTILLEGGIEAQRLELGLYWAMAANCQIARAEGLAGRPARPCLACPECRQIAAREYLDLLIYDGRISNKEDEENPGIMRALRVENIRELKSRAASHPHGDGKRAVLLQGLLQTRGDALNSLLKILEEPCGHTLFVLLAPQRSQILPTLVSRSFCITLPWPGSETVNPEVEPWEGELVAMLRSGGSDFLEKIAAKGAVDATMAARIILMCQRSLARILGVPNAASRDIPMDQALAPLAARTRSAALLSRWLAEAHGMLMAGVNPARVLEAFSARLFLLLRQG